MKYFLAAILLISVPVCYADSVAPGSVVPFFITDSNLNTSHRAIETISTSGLVDFTLNGIPISGPSSMTETAVNSGIFLLYLTIPTTVNGKPVQNGDVVVLTYHQQADYSGNPTTITQSVTISQTPNSPISASQDRVRIGHTFLLKLYAPNWNLDSYKPDTIPLNLVEFRDGGFVTTLEDPAFIIPTFGLQETGPNTDTFTAQIKIPREVDGHQIEIGDTIEFSFTDPTEGASAGTTNIFVKVGYTNLQTVPPSTTLSPGIPTLNSFKDATKIWCDAKASDASLVKILQNLAADKFVTITKPSSTTHIPLWFKNTVCWWSNDKISDNDFTIAVQFLLDKGFLKI